MAKQQKKKTIKHPTRERILLYVGLIVVIGLAGFFTAYKPLMVAREKDNFLKAQEGLEQLYSEIVATVGEPDQNKRENECSYASGKFEDGPLSCKVAIYLLYEERDAAASTELMQRISTIAGTEPLRPAYSRQDREGFIPSNEYRGFQVFYQKYRTINTIGCSLSYNFGGAQFSEHISTDSEENLLIDLSCSGSARAEHF